MAEAAPRIVVAVAVAAAERISAISARGSAASLFHLPLMRCETRAHNMSNCKTIEAAALQSQRYKSAMAK